MINVIKKTKLSPASKPKKCPSKTAHTSVKAFGVTVSLPDRWVDSILRRRLMKFLRALVVGRLINSIQASSDYSPKAIRHTAFADRSNGNILDRRTLPQLQQTDTIKQPNAWAGDIGKPSEIWKSLEREIVHRTTPLQCGRPVLIIAADRIEGNLISQHFQDLGQDVQLTNSLEGALGVLSDLPLAWSLAVCQIDDLADLEDVVDDLRDFRKSTPAVPLLLISSRFARDDLSAERLALCDASVTNNCNASALDAGIFAAIQNNRAWNRRTEVEQVDDRMFGCCQKNANLSEVATKGLKLGV
ncbi:hypothetical protein OAN307_c29400 [Octadecabacter antarcticus 307]|uniref:Uncharacterized protein n=1 Tax=Octadecabacter antarcticus 307 TaxID=391626 RepID=M9RFC0_9RHOB|nr:hypothetical protein [Octadecabacter antarcticus]AGI68490.1 hypothetical protein OAN307_c29400 [Octadecabacter antarcticus 307]